MLVCQSVELPNAADKPELGWGGFTGAPYIFRLNNPEANKA
jgi:hypothetical protein